jgi:cbb3-type cytochrome oxidase subunit 1
VPRLSIWLVRAALLALAAGATLGAVLLADPALAGGVARWRPLHAELLTVGWTVQLAFGVAYWILPRFRTGRERGREELGWAAFVLVNLGVVLVGIGRSAPGAESWALAGRSAEGLAVAAFAAQAWPRVKPFR